MSEEKGTGAITGITNFLFLAFILPGIVYVCFIVVLFPVHSIESLVPGIEMGADVAIGAVVTVGLTLTSMVFALDICLRPLFEWKSRAAAGPKQREYAKILFSNKRERELGWYFWQLWGQMIMHQNIWGGLAIIYIVYRTVTYDVWPSPFMVSITWRDWTLVVIVANVVCWRMFSRWYADALSRLQEPAQV
jgi:hypothetical protein